MAKTDLKIVATATNDRTINTTISDINPALQPTDARALAQKLNALTSNMYVKTDRIETVNLDTTDDKTARNPSLRYHDYLSDKDVDITNTEQPMTIPLTHLQNGTKLVFNYSNNPPLPNDTSRLILTNWTTTVGSLPNPSVTNFLVNNNYQYSLTLSESVAQTLTFTFTLAANDIYQGWRKDVIINLVGGE